MDSNQILVLRDGAREQLMQIKTVEEGISHLNKLKSIEVWVKAEKKDAELQNIVAEQKLRTQRILGGLIADGQRNGSIANQGNRISNIPDRNISTLNDIGLSAKQSSTFQAIASIPEKTFEEYIQDKKQAVNNAVAELTTAGALRLSKSIQEKQGRSMGELVEAAKSISPESEVEELAKFILECYTVDQIAYLIRLIQPT